MNAKLIRYGVLNLIKMRWISKGETFDTFLQKTLEMFVRIWENIFNMSKEHFGAIEVKKIPSSIVFLARQKVFELVSKTYGQSHTNSA